MTKIERQGGPERDSASTLAAFPQPVPAAADRRRGALDSLRLFAIMAVLFDHYTDPQDIRIGNISVRFFLLLSGFLITRTLMRFDGADWTTYRAALRSFYGRRALRIWPLYYAIVFALFFAGYFSWKWLAVDVLFLTNFVQAWENDWDVPGYLGHVWTLCVQEQFYLFWPVVFLMLSRKRLLFLAGMIAVSIAFRGVLLAEGRQFDVAAYVFPLASFDALALGALLAILESRMRIVRPALAIAILTGLCLTILYHGPLAVQVVALPTLQLVPLGILTWMVFDDRLGRMGRMLEWPSLVFLGRISLGIYLLHMPLWLMAHELAPPAIMPFVEHPSLTTFAIMSSLTIGAAIASWLILEQPLQRFRRFLPYPERR